MNKKALHVILAVITVVLCATTIFFRVKSDQATNNLRDSNKQVKKEKTKYEKKKSDISNNIYYYISKNGDEKTKPIGQQYVNSELLDTASNKLFGFVFNYSNSDDYRKRKDLASSCNPFVKTSNKRRGKSANRQTTGRQHRRAHRHHRALTIGPGHVQIGLAGFRVPQGRQKIPHPG